MTLLWQIKKHILSRLTIDNDDFIYFFLYFVCYALYYDEHELAVSWS